jgi:hypothetical protein
MNQKGQPNSPTQTNSSNSSHRASRLRVHVCEVWPSRALRTCIYCAAGRVKPPHAAVLRCAPSCAAWHTTSSLLTRRFVSGTDSIQTVGDVQALG